MYLALLNKKQKELFSSLAYDIAASDGDFSESEKLLIESYSAEMNEVIDIDKLDRDVQRVIMEINECCFEKEKKIIVFELIGLALADSNYDDDERALINNAMEVFGIDKSFAQFCEEKIIQYLKLQMELNTAIIS